MAHFAELDGSNVVTRVIVVDNAHVPSDKHADGETWCVNFFGGGTWKQTSYNNKFRKQYAGKGYTYDSSKNIFIVSKPYPSWTLNSSSDWEAPVDKPDDGKRYNWNETDTQWDEVPNG